MLLVNKLQLNKVKNKNKRVSSNLKIKRDLQNYVSVPLSTLIFFILENRVLLVKMLLVLMCNESNKFSECQGVLRPKV